MRSWARVRRPMSSCKEVLSSEMAYYSENQGALAACLHCYNRPMAKAKLSHVHKSGRARMVDVTDKLATERLAVAAGEVHMRPETLALIADNALKKGDALAVAQVAGIQAAKRTAELIPFCHPLPVDHLSIDFELDQELPGIRIRATARSVGKTGVEMEALTAVCVAALTIYDMAKSAQKSMRIENIRLVKKSGGKSGAYEETEKSL